MKKNLKSLVALGLALCMLAGCGSAAAETKESQPAQESKETSSVVEEAPAEEAVEEASQYPDYLNLDSARPVVKDGEEVTLKIAVRRDNVAESDIDEQWFVKFIEEKLNINLEIEEVISENNAERTSLMLASNELPDIIINLAISTNDVVKYGVEGGQLLPMSDYINEELTPNIVQLLAENEAAKVECTAPDGKMYTVPIQGASFTGFGDTIGNSRLFIDTTFMNAAGWEKAPATLDEYLDMLRDVKALDPSTMGVDEIYPLISVDGLDAQYLLNAFGWAVTDWGNITNPCWDEPSQSVVVPCLQDKYAEYVKVLHTMYSEGLLHPDYYTMDSTAARALMAENKVAVIGEWAPYVSIPERFEDFICGTPLSSEWSETPVVTQSNAYSMGVTYISADTEYPEVCMRFLDYLYSPEGSVYSQYGCPADSEDTMGIIEGFWLGEDNTVVYGDVESGAYPDWYTFAVNKIILSQGTPINENYKNLYIQEMLGVENPQFRELDVTDPDDHYRYICYDAQHDYLVPALPSLYMSEEQSSRYTDLKTVLESYADSETAKLVSGQRPIEEAEMLVDELMAMGGEEYLELVKELYANYSR